MTKRKTVEPIVTEQAFNNALDQYYSAHVAYEKKKADVEAKLQAIRNQHEESLNDALALRTDAEVIIRKYVPDHRDDLFKEGKKSATLRGVTVSYRLSPPSLQLEDGKSWEEVKAALSKSKKLGIYLVPSIEINKAMLLRERPAGLDKIGLSIAQDERLSIAVKE